MKLHHCVGARSFRPLWALEALGLSYDLAMLPFPPRVHAKGIFPSTPSARSRSSRTARRG